MSSLSRRLLNPYGDIGSGYPSMSMSNKPLTFYTKTKKAVSDV
jgi:hypothetical protein